MSEVEGLLNSEEVDFLLDTEGTAGKPTVGGVAQEVTMRGDLDQISLSDIFQTLAIAKMEGLFRVRNPLEQRLLHFRGGFVRILVPNRVASRRLGQRLVQAGMVTQEILRTALLEQRRDHLPLGQIMVRQGYISQQQIEEVVSMQATEELFALFTWRHGTFEFYKGAVTDPQVVQRLDQCVEFEVNGLLLEVARRTDEWECIIQAIGNLDEVPAIERDTLAAADELSEAECELLKVTDGKVSYRELAESTLQGLFESARLARVLAERGLLRNLSDESMIDTAREQLELGNQKRALMRLQTLRDRDGERSSEVLMAMADLLRQCGEGRLGSVMLLEVAQRKSDPREALDLARQARAASGRDPDVLAFLRTCILQLGGTTPQELEEVTLALLDEQIDRDLSEAAMEVLAECEAETLVGPQILARKARLLQRHKDIPGAVEALLRIVEHPDVVDNRTKVMDVYEQVLKLDRSRKDIYKALKLLRSTRTARLAKLGILATTLLLLVGSAVVFVHHQQTEQALQKVGQEVAELLRGGDRAGARTAIEQCREKLGNHEQLDDLQRQVDFAQATEDASLRRAQRKQALEKMAEAADLLARGELEQSLRIYQDLHGRDDLRAEVKEVTGTRLEAMRVEMEALAKALASELPPAPGPIPERKELEASLTWLRARVSAERLLQAQNLIQLLDGQGLPEWLHPDLSKKLGQTARAALPLIQQGLERLRQIDEVYFRGEADLKLAPVYKDARRFEQELEFAQALACYRRLKAEHSDTKMRAHFSDQVERYAQIVQFLDVIAAAEKNADFTIAQSQYRALRGLFPDIPFDRLVRLPLVVETRPAGATVLWNGQEVGKTPLHLSFQPGNHSTVALRLQGFADEQTEIRGDTTGSVKSLLARVPDWEADIGALVEQSASTDGSRIITVDRAGVVTALDSQAGGQLWQWPSGDLSGYLSPPLRFGKLVLVCSLDGTARGIDIDTGQPTWQQDGLATDSAPVLCGPVLAVATTDKRVVLMSAERGKRHVSLPLPDRAATDLVAAGEFFLVVCQDGTALCFNATTGKEVWRHPLGRSTAWRACTVGHHFILLGDNGAIQSFDSRSGNSLWNKNLDGQVEGAPVSNGRELCVVLSSRVLLIDAASGNARTQSPGENEAWAGTPVLLKNRVAVPQRDGSWRVLSTETLEVLYQLRGPKRLATTGTAWSSNGLLIGTQDRKLLFFRALH